MADLKKLALSRKAFAGTVKGKLAAEPGKPEHSLEDSCRDEIGEAELAFRNRLNQEDKRRRAATDAEFWFAVYFQSRSEKEAFLKKFCLEKIGDKYLSGRMVERVLQTRSIRRVRDIHKDRR